MTINFPMKGLFRNIEFFHIISGRKILSAFDWTTDTGKLIRDIIFNAISL